MMKILIHIIVIVCNSFTVFTQDTDIECQDRMQKMKEFYCVSQCIGVSDKTISPKRSFRTPPLTTSVACDAFDYEQMKKCCTVPDFMGVNDGGKTQCEKEAGFSSSELTAQNAYEDYILNKWLDKDNSLDLTSSDNKKKHAAFCYTECLFSGSLWFADETLLISNITASWIHKAVNKIYQDILLKAIEKCGETVPTVFAINTIKNDGKKCSTLPWLFLQCVRRSIAQYCPISGSQANICKKEQEKLKSCDFFV